MARNEFSASSDESQILKIHQS